MPRVPAAPQAPSLEDAETGPYIEDAQSIAQSQPEVYVEEKTTEIVAEVPEERTVITRKEFTILVGRVISKNYQTVKYEETVVFSLEGGGPEQKRTAYEKVRDSIIARVCGTADAIALGEKL